MSTSLASTDRVIRVFISSTFRDMQAERDHLVKFIFPELRKLCESRAVTWGEVDLRWGVTDEQKAEGKVLPICLEEIKRCRPYFIGLLGKRYGWIPDAIPPELIEREPWLREHFQHSVTELEILHGVLRNPEMAEHAFFYFRDPRYIESLPPERQQDFTTEDSESAGKLQGLKDRIRQSGFPVRENYADPKALGALVLADLTAVINRLFPEGSQPDPLDREAMDHEAYAQSRERVYIGRPEYFARLDAHAAGTSDQPLVVLGESGSGKSALLANWVARYRHAHPEALVLQHYIGATPYSADWAAMLRRLMGEFKRKLDIQQDVPDKPDALRSAFPNWLHMAAARGRVVLVLDALNQLEDRDGAPDLVWLPPVMPANVRLIVSTLPGRPLEAIQKRHWPEMSVSPLNLTERKQLIAEYLAQSAKHLSLTQLDCIASAPQAGNPLYLRVLLDELRLFGVYEGLDERIGYYLHADSPRDLYRQVIARWEEDYGAGTTLVSETLSLLWAARRGLSESELLQALGTDDQPLAHAVWSPLFLAMSDALVSRGGLLTFAHDFLREAVELEYLLTTELRRGAHLRIAGYFASQEPGPRMVDEFPWHLAQSESWDKLYSLLADLRCLELSMLSNPFDVKSYWAQIERNSGLRIVDAYRSVLDTPECFGDHVATVAILLNYSGHPNEALSLQSYLIQHHRETGDTEKLVRCLGIQSAFLYARGDFDGTLILVKEMEHLCRTLNYRSELETTLEIRAMILHARGDADAALALLAEQEHICRELGDRHGLQRCAGHKALIARNRGRFDEALVLQREKERVCLELGDRDSLHRCLYNQASILSERGDLDGAIRLYREVERICRELGNTDELQRCLCDEALILLDRGELDTSMTLLREVEGVCRELGSRNGLMRCLHSQGEILYAQRDWNEALVLYREAERLCREMGDKNGIADCLVNETLILHEEDDLDGATALNQEAERIYRDLGNKHGLAVCLEKRALLQRTRGDQEGAMALHLEAGQMFRELGSKAWLQRSLANLAEILFERGDWEGATTAFKEQELLARELRDKRALPQALAKQALILTRLAHWDEAIVLLQDEERIRREQGDMTGLQVCLENQALILWRRGQLDSAMGLFEEQETICRRLGHNKGLRCSLGNQALILYDRGDVAGAMALRKEEERMAREQGDEEGLVASLNEQGLMLTEMGKPAEAMTLLKEAERISREVGERSKLLISLGNQGLILHKGGDWDGAMLLYHESERIARELEDKDALQHSLINQGAILMERGNPGEAMRLLKEAELICRELAAPDGLARALANEASLLGLQMARPREALPLAEEAYRLASEHGLKKLAEQVTAISDILRSGSFATVESNKEPQQLATEELMALAHSSFDKGLWEAAETMYRQLLRSGEPIAVVGPKIITCFLNAHPTLSAEAIAEIEGIVQQLEVAGQSVAAASLRRQLSDKIAASQPKKPRWRSWQ